MRNTFTKIVWVLSAIVFLIGVLDPGYTSSFLKLNRIEIMLLGIGGMIFLGGVDKL